LNYAHVAARLFNRPLFLHPASAEAILWGLRDRFDKLEIEAPSNKWDIEATRFVGTTQRANGRSALSRAHQGVAIISSLGELVNRGAWVNSNSGLVSYEGLAAQLKDAANDPEVHDILWDLDSPGGEAIGMSDLADVVRHVNETKPVTVFAGGILASAGFGIASGAKQIVASKSALVGSIGTLLMHLDYSGRYEQAGVKPTLIYAGAHKVDGNPFGPLSESVTQDLQAEVMAFYNDFLATVEAGRGSRLPAAAAKATEARVFMGKDAVQKGMADDVGTFDDVLADLVSRKPGSIKPTGGIKMITYTQEQFDQAVASAKADGASGVAAAKTDAAATERKRVAAIMGLEEAKGREKQAGALAATEVSVEAAKAVLAASPKEVDNSIAARASEGVGPSYEKAKPEAVQGMWDRAVNSLNAQVDARAN